MKVTIDNQDGRGALDYTGALVGAAPVKIERKLNAPSVCTAVVNPNAGLLGTPARNGRMVVEADNGALLFTGYLVGEPTLEYCGTGVQGPLYVARVSATSDEVILDRLGIPPTAQTVYQQATELLANLTLRTGATGVTMAAGGSTAVAGSFHPNPAETWSENAAVLATMARGAYRVQDGQISLTSIGAATHTLQEGDGSLALAGLTATRTKMLVNDVTVCGQQEPQAYVTEVFQGDGTTTGFQLSERPYAVRGVKAQLVLDTFEMANVNPQLWKVTDPQSRFSLTAAGLTVGGGNGVDGGTYLGSWDAYEMGGALLLEATGVQAVAGSDGYVGCLYSGMAQVGELFAGFHVKQSGGATVAIPVVEGAEAGGSVTLMTGHSYTLRIRVFCREAQRVLASYYSVNDSGASVRGGGILLGGAALVLEAQDTTSGSLQAPVVLYDGMVASAPASCTLVPVNSTNFTGSIRSISLKQAPMVWVTRVPASGGPKSVRLGIATEGADAKLTYTGKITFYAGSVPQTGDLIYVFYRIAGRSVGRMVNSASVAAESGGELPAVSRLVCSVTVPATRSSADCENAALAILDVASSRSAAWAGSYTAFNLHQQSGDVWPGDVLAVSAPSAGMSANLVVRGVTIEGANAAPELLRYQVTFANDWADELSLKTSRAVPKDAWLPLQAVSAPAALDCLSGLTISGVTSTGITVDAGASAPAGGGFEVRRSDWKFGPGTDQDLVLRSPVPNFTIPRETPVEQYFVRMYDGATPPNYSRFSSAIFVNVTM